uniref:PID domain-containing protein n=1 Tax=Strigamia maritima TaxID=126957 RepID=T1IV08_STRMM
MATPICRCRVLYLGSSVPHITKDGLQGMQEPLRQLYAQQGICRGIDSWLSVWSNGILVENLDETRKKVTKFYPMDSLHFCAAVRHVLVPNGDKGGVVQRFLPLDSPFARIPTDINPPLFACTLRRTSGIKILECHLFACKKEMAANALTKCCFQAYADTMLAQKLESDSYGRNAYSSVKPSGEYDDLMSVYGASVSGRASRNSTMSSMRSTLRRTFSRPKPMLMPAMFFPVPTSQTNTVKKCKKKNLSKKMLKKSNGPPSPLWSQLPAGGRPTPIYHQQLPPVPIPSYSRTSTIPCYSIKGSDEPYFLPSRPTSSADFYSESYDGGTLRAEKPMKRRKEKTASVYSTDDNGIYHRKGHMNERAFSHSIRQEHRSRSHNSLSTLVFNGNSPPSDKYGEDDITQMVSELNLFEDGSDDSGSRYKSQNGTLTNKESV